MFNRQDVRRSCWLPGVGPLDCLIATRSELQSSHHACALPPPRPSPPLLRSAYRLGPPPCVAERKPCFKVFAWRKTLLYVQSEDRFTYNEVRPGGHMFVPCRTRTHALAHFVSDSQRKTYYLLVGSVSRVDNHRLVLQVM